MTIIDIADIIDPLMDGLTEKYKRKALATADEWLMAITDAVNKQCEKGFRLTGMIYDNDLKYQGALSFEKCEKKWKYIMNFGGDLDRTTYMSGILKSMEKMGTHHATIFFFNISMTPIYFIAKEFVTEEIKEIAPTGTTETSKVVGTKGTKKKSSRKAK